MAKKAPLLTWNDKGKLSLSNYLKKAKSSGALAVLSREGELLWQHGKWKSQDWTSIGSLITAVQSGSLGIATLFGVKASSISVGQSYWLAWNQGPWIIVGLKVALKESLLKDIFKVLKSAPKHESVKSAHELAGLSAEGLEATLSKGLE